LEAEALTGTSELARDAVYALSMIGPASLPALGEKIEMSVKRERVRIWCVEAIGQMEHSELARADSRHIVQVLKALLNESSHELQLEAAKALGQIGAPAGVAAPDLERLLKSSRPLEGIDVAAALYRVSKRDAPGLTFLVRMLEQEDPKIRVHAADILLRLVPNSPVIVQAEIRALTNESRLVRMFAANTLRELGASAEPALQALRLSTKDSDKDVCDSAKIAIEVIQAAVRKKNRDLRTVQ
jgi:HEAT repeat protein